MSEFANQYGIDLGAIDQAVSQKKTAEQNIMMNDMRINALNRQENKDLATDKAEQDYMKDPSTAVASTLAQQMQWNTLNKEKRIESTAVLIEV